MRTAAEVSRLVRLIAVCGFVAGSAPETGAQAQQPDIPPVRPLGPILAATKDSLKSVTAIRVLSDGRVLVNDRTASRVLLFDAALGHPIVVADTTGETAKAYGKQGAAIFPFHGDSSLFADFASLSMLVVDPSGKLGRVIAAPRAPGPVWLNNPSYSATMDEAGDLVSRWAAGTASGRVGGVGIGARGGGTPPTPDPTPVRTTDSAYILRINIESKQTDTLAWLMNPTQYMYEWIGPAGGLRRSSLRDPLPTQDAWTLMPDGTVAVVREHDYHIDWIAPDHSVTSSPKIAHVWVHLSDSARTAIMDSTRRADSLSSAHFQGMVDSLALAARKAGRKVDTTSGGQLIQIQTAEGTTINYAIGSAGGTQQRYMDPGDLTDYLPPFDGGAGSVRADADGNVWILAKRATPPQSGAVYDVVNRQGKLVDRVQLPGGTTLVGFGKGVAYLTSREGAGLQLARARIH
ncbi:MAG TPA: hypothetical protein VMH39_13245 [Gemmatimonadaceae bacterium]|nr:hypothetical protein [Gemmatimonadaceae bacterium]